MKEGRYVASVVTPCYKIDMELFVKCFECLKNQTIGFENIEWIVVSHNSSDEQFDEINKIVAGNDNVKTFKLNNDRRTPSSPRNYGLNYVTGKYVGFLDADDTYTENCVEKCTNYMKNNDAQLAVFRMESISADPARLAVRQFLFVDQTKELVLLEKGKWDSKKFIYGAALNVTSKMYDMDFLNEHSLRFDEDVTFAEDNMFNLSAFSEADRICILPQLIGYKYWMNEGSMVQTFNKSAEEVVRYARGFEKVIENGLSHGLYMNNVMCDLLGYQSAIMLASDSLTLEDRVEVFNILGKYLDMLQPVEVSKLYTKQMAGMVTKLPKFAIGKPKAIMRIIKISKALGVNIEDKIKANM